MVEPSEYLQPDFNPATYKVAQLRNVLLQHDVSYPSGAKKTDLIKLFNEHVKPTAAGRLKELNSVVANDDGIEIVEKKKEKHSKIFGDNDDDDKPTSELKVEKKRKIKKDDDVKKSPRKSSKPKDSESKETETLKSPKKKRVTSDIDSTNVLSKVPILQVSPPRARERSPKRKLPKSNEDKEAKHREQRSPVRKVTKKKTPASPVKKLVHANSESDDEEIEILNKEEFDNSKSPFKVDKIEKADSSFSNDNVFQSSPDIKPVKSIPRKRATDDTQRSPRKTTKTVRKTVFSSSPEQERPRAKSPSKKALVVSKFEDDLDLPPSDILQQELEKHDIFSTADNELNEAFIFNSVTETQSRKKSPSPVPTPAKLSHNQADNFQTPNDGNVSIFSDYSSVNPTPVKEETTPSKRTSLIPDFSRFNVSSGFAQKLGLIRTGESKDQKIIKDEEDKDLELLEDEPESDHDDSTLAKLQNDVELANAALLEEAKDALKQVNEIFEDEKAVLGSTEESLVEEEKGTKEPFSFAPLLSFLKNISVFLLFAFVTFSTLWYREQRILIGYCGSEIDQPTFPNTDNEYLIKVDEFLQTLKPPCLQCPVNAICLPSLQLKCKQDYVVYEPWYKLHGVLPFSAYCVEDTEKENIINEVVSKSLDLLRTRNANVRCGDGDDLEVGISDDELYQFFFNSKNPTISDEEFEELWARVLEDLEHEPEISLRYEGSDDSGSATDDLSTDEIEEETTIPQKQKIIFRSNSSVKLSISCKFKKEIYERFQQHKAYIIGAILSFIFIIYSYFQVLSYKQRQSKIQEISSIIINKLQKQSRNSINDPTGLTNRYLSAIQLRDELLSNHKKDRFKLWDSILSQLDKNSNVRSSTKEIHGEIVRVLEWISDVN